MKIKIFCSIIILGFMMANSNLAYTEDRGILTNKDGYVYKSGSAYGKKGYIDLAKTFTSFEKMKDFDKALGVKGKEKDNERAPMVTELNKMREKAPTLAGYEKFDKLENLINVKKEALEKFMKEIFDPTDDSKVAQHRAMAEELSELKDQILSTISGERNSQKEPIDDKIKEISEFDVRTRNWLRAARETMVKDILSDMENEIKFIGDTEGYSVITNDRFAKEGADLTLQVIDSLNKKYERNKSDPEQINADMATQAASSTNQEVKSGGDSISELERLVTLKEKGALTEDEFQNQKKKILSK